MSQGNVEVVERVVAAVNERDVESYLACCTEDIRLETPMAGGVYSGPDDIRRFFADIRDTAPDFHLTIERLVPIAEDRVLALLHGTASGRVSGIATPIDYANVYELVNGKIKRTRVFSDRREALEAVGLRE